MGCKFSAKSRAAGRREKRFGSGFSVTTLVGLGNAVVPAEGVLVENGPEKAESERQGGEQEGSDAAAEGGVGGISITKGAEGDFGIAHPRGRIGEAEKQELVDEPHSEEGHSGADEGHAAVRQAGAGDGEDQRKQQKCAEGERAID